MDEKSGGAVTTLSLFCSFLTGVSAITCIVSLGLGVHKWLTLGPGMEAGNATLVSLFLGGMAFVFWELRSAARE